MGKVISMSGYLQMGLHKMSDQLSVPDHITQEGQTYKDSFDHGTERWTLAGILQNSSNVGMIMAGENYPDEQRYEYLTKFGIGQPTGLNLPGESSGLLTNPSAWDLRTRNTILFGQATPSTPCSSTTWWPPSRTRVSSSSSRSSNQPPMPMARH